MLPFKIICKQKSTKLPLFDLQQFRLDASECDFAFHQHRNPAIVIGKPDEDAALGHKNTVTVEHRLHLDAGNLSKYTFDRFLAMDQHLKLIALLAAHRRKTRSVPHRQRKRTHQVKGGHNAMFHALDGDRSIGGALGLAGFHVGEHGVRKPGLFTLTVETDNRGVVERALVQALAENFGHEALVAHAGVHRIVYRVDSIDGLVARRMRQELRLAASNRLDLESRSTCRNEPPTKAEGQLFPLHPRGVHLGKVVGFTGKRNSDKDRHERGDLEAELDTLPKHQTN